MGMVEDVAVNNHVLARDVMDLQVQANLSLWLIVTWNAQSRNFSVSLLVAFVRKEN